MKAFLLVLILCTAASIVKAEGFQLPVMIDAGYQARFQSGRGWHGPEALLQLRFDKLFGNRDLALHHLAVGGFWETGFGYEPNPTRLAVMAGYGFGSDRGPTGGDFDISLTRTGDFPLTRSLMFNGYVQGMLGFISSRGTRGHDGQLQSQDALRLEGRAAFGFVAVELQTRMAFNFNLRDGRFIDSELAFGLELGRPILPVGLRVAYTHHFMERAGGGGVQVALRLVL